MIFTCRKCKNDFLTEACLHVVIPTNIGSVLECGCRYRKEITRIKKALEIANEAIGFYADVTGNPKQYMRQGYLVYNLKKKIFVDGGEKAREAQKQIKEIMEG